MIFLGFLSIIFEYYGFTKMHGIIFIAF